MFLDDLRRITGQNLNPDNKAYLLNLVKEGIQTYILYFIYTSNEFRGLIFTGGTCLKRVYGLNRLSVDLDFDYETKSSPKILFAEGIKNWFHKEHLIKNIETIVRGDTVKVKMTNMPELLGEIGKQSIFVSVDISPITSKKYKTEKNLISTPEFSFIVNNFDLPTMFANKICAFLTRNFKFGKEQTDSFKARDVYDLFWLCQRSKQNQYKIKPDFGVISERIGTKEQTLNLLAGKLALLKDSQIIEQLLPFFPDRQFVESFVSSYKETLPKDLEVIFSPDV